MISYGAFHSSGKRVFLTSFLTLLTSVVLSFLVGWVVSLFLVKGFGVTAFMTFVFSLFTISHLLIHRYRYVDPIELIKHVFFIVAGLAMLAAAFVGTSGNDNAVAALVGFLIIPFLAVLPIVMAVGDKPPPKEYGSV